MSSATCRPTDYNRFGSRERSAAVFQGWERPRSVAAHRRTRSRVPAQGLPELQGGVGQHRGPQTRTAPGAAAGLPAGPHLLIVPGADPRSGGHGAACAATTAPQAAQRDPAPGPLPTAGPPAAAGLAAVPPPTWLNLSTMPRQVEHARRRRSPAPRAGGSIKRTA